VEKGRVVVEEAIIMELLIMEEVTMVAMEEVEEAVTTVEVMVGVVIKFLRRD